MFKQTVLSASLVLAAASFAVAQEREWDRADRLSRPNTNRPQESMFRVGILGESADTRWDFEDEDLDDIKYKVRGSAAFLSLEYDYRVDRKLVLNAHARLSEENLRSTIKGEHLDN